MKTIRQNTNSLILRAILEECGIKASCSNVSHNYISFGFSVGIVNENLLKVIASTLIGKFKEYLVVSGTKMSVTGGKVVNISLNIEWDED